MSEHDAYNPEHNAETRFDLNTWLLARQHDSEYILVEIGHQNRPITANQEFHGRRLYVGIEAWVGQPDPSEKVHSFAKEHQYQGREAENIAHIAKSDKPYVVPSY